MLEADWAWLHNTTSVAVVYWGCPDCEQSLKAGPMKLASMLLLSLMLTMCAAGPKDTPEQAFWKWFQSNESSLFAFEKDQEHTFDRLGAEVHKLNPSLTFECGPKENGRREFVISADGIREAFPEVEALYASAPSLPRWKFIKFRPRRTPSDTSYQ